MRSRPYRRFIGASRLGGAHPKLVPQGRGETGCRVLDPKIRRPCRKTVDDRPAQSGHLAGGDRQGRRNQENEANGLSLCHGEILELCPITVNGVTDRGVVTSWHSLADLPV